MAEVCPWCRFHIRHRRPQSGFKNHILSESCIHKKKTRICTRNQPSANDNHIATKSPSLLSCPVNAESNFAVSIFTVSRGGRGSRAAPQRSSLASSHFRPGCPAAQSSIPPANETHVWYPVAPGPWAFGFLRWEVSTAVPASRISLLLHGGVWRVLCPPSTISPPPPLADNERGPG
jgi:hypothetical protein